MYKYAELYTVYLYSVYSVGERCRLLNFYTTYTHYLFLDIKNKIKINLEYSSSHQYYNVLYNQCINSAYYLNNLYMYILHTFVSRRIKTEY